jgi:hypothetical protein
METKIPNPKEPQDLLDSLQARSRELTAVYSARWRADDRPPACQALAGAVTSARRAIHGLEETRNPALRPLVDRIMIESEIADGTLRNPSLLQR